MTEKTVVLNESKLDAIHAKIEQFLLNETLIDKETYEFLDSINLDLYSAVEE